MEAQQNTIKCGNVSTGENVCKIHETKVSEISSPYQIQYDTKVSEINFQKFKRNHGTSPYEQNILCSLCFC